MARRPRRAKRAFGRRGSRGIRVAPRRRMITRHPLSSSLLLASIAAACGAPPSEVVAIDQSEALSLDCPDGTEPSLERGGECTAIDDAPTTLFDAPRPN